ncbi:MAG TPA: lytic murein transglycosylase [Candidatus Pacearchaeota archaeon]|nr:lytic murein transglycosylase [Candidatus Pacearchaeota archaeon]HOK94436.1 lytic murein transglycosylase [Candidatus Pacearchaeota archaeon]HPO75510.1 lytic murein transglycosylase [Candidatus Pacearchaeota archaeon]
MIISTSKKFIVLILTFSLTLSSLPLLPIVSATDSGDFCNQVKNATCNDDLKALSEDARLKNCSQTVQSELLNLTQKCLASLNTQKSQTEKQLNEIKTQESTAQRTLNNLTLNIKQLNTEIASLNLTLAELENAIKEREKAIQELDASLSHEKEVLAETVRHLYEYSTTSYVEVLLSCGTLSDFNQKLEEMESLQNGLQKSIEEISKAKQQMEQEKVELAKKKAEQEQYKELQEFSRQSLTVRQQQQQYLLQKLTVAKTPLEQEMARIETELIELRSAMTRIQSYLAQWVLTGQVNWSTIFSAVQRASSSTGVRPALLLGILQIESKFGTGLGIPGHYQDYCNWSSSPYCAYPTEAAALESICQKFGYKPTEVPMSKSCAIGPSQFLPCTWLAYGGGGNPWDLNDAVMAMAKYLSKNGAASGNEKGAVFAYNHSNSYVDSVITSAEAWQDVIDICGLNLSCPQMQQRLETKFSNIPAQ